jgi:hypothetical protein
MSEEDSRKYFLMGLVHDIGYEFSKEAEEHPEIGADILESVADKEWFSDQEWLESINAIRHHGKVMQYEYTIADYILNEADLTVDSEGNDVSMEERLEDIKDRYGQLSRQYKNAAEMKRRLEEQEKQ